ncbi:iron-sulfur cluster repair di-iron protein [Puia sp. P3]|uniref:iron-sulfur cluster repair di-iron protein n=1 Tax=Puia sp. P3 TaxID=3423952 RepID=UPI003D67ED91
MSNGNETCLVGELAAQDYRKADVFQKYGIDFCCGGGQTLAEAARLAGISEGELRSALEAAELEGASSLPDLSRWTTDRLIDEIVDTHHRYVREVLPVLLAYGRKIAGHHGDVHPELRQLDMAIRSEAQDLLEHLDKEEGVLFPGIRRLTDAGGGASDVNLNFVRHAIEQLEEEHTGSGKALGLFRQLTNNYTPPQDACNSYCFLYAKLKEFDLSLQQHIHLENNILFPSGAFPGGKGCRSVIIKTMKYLFITVLLTVGCLLSSAQTMVHGRVVDRDTKEPLEFAEVRDRTGGSALTDRDGRFPLPVHGSGDSLEVSYVGYRAVCVCVAECCDDPACCRGGVCQHGMELALGRQGLDLKSVTIVPAPNASFHTISQVDLYLRPVNSAQDLMRLVPGLFLGQHQGGGLAEHIFYRGFDADHGTDVNVSVDGMPVNLVSHIHGQGFADLHFLIPELVAKYDYGKGPYYAEYGDFTTAGYVGFRTYDVLDKSEVKLEGGQFNTGRVLAKVRLDGGYVAGEAFIRTGLLTGRSICGG